MNVLSLSGVSASYHDLPLFEEVTLGIDAGEKIGFIGRNGSGKTTFLGILRGEIEPDAGTVARNRELTMSALEQRPVFGPGMSVDEYLHAGAPPEGGAARERGPSYLETARSYCRELGIEDTTTAMGTLSGGTVRKAAIARCLARGAGLLTLDEPTNHLDLDTIEWLESMLRDAAFGFVLVTHDRYFLDAVCGSIMEIDSRRIYKYPGTYSEYLERKADREAALERAAERRSTILKRELEWWKRGPKARTGKDKGRAGRVRALLEEGARRELVMSELSSASRRLGKKVLELKGAGKLYGGRQVISAFTYSFRRGERVGIVGPNGSGKTTFLDLVSGRVAPDAGEVVRGETLEFGYFDQTGSHRNGELTVLDYIRERAERIVMADGSTLQAEQFLERFLFPRAMQAQTLDRLSGGEWRRLDLVRLLSGSPNFLLLDEPTNDLDLDTIRLLEDYLADFPGCILLVSHDRALLDRVTDYLFVLDGAGGIRGFTGSYTASREAIAAERASGPPPVKSDSRRPARREKSAALSFRERQEYGGILEEISRLEEEQKSLEALFLEPVREPAERERTARRYHELVKLLQSRIARWEELEARSGE